MSVVAPPEPPRPDELEALIREARARQRRRRLTGAVVIAAAATAALGIHALLAGGGPAVKRGGGPRPTPVVSTPRCRSDQLVAHALGAGVYTGHRVMDFTFRNASGDPCTLRGRPRVQLLMRDGRRVAAREQPIRNLTRRGSVVPVRAVVLRPGAVASLHVVVVDQVGRNGPEPQVYCSWSRAILVTLPGAGAPVRMAFSLSNCGLAVTPVFAGRPDRYSFG